MSSSPLLLALRVRDLSSAVGPTSLLVGDAAVMKGMFDMLGGDNEEVIIIVLQALQLLSSNSNNKAILSANAALLIRLANLTDRDNVQIKKLSSQCLDNLQSFVNNESNSSKLPSDPPVCSRPSLSSGRYLQNLSLSVSGVNNEKQQSEIEKALIGIKGVISVSFAPGAFGHCNIYTSIKQELLLALLTKAVSEIGNFSICINNQPNNASFSADKENSLAANNTNNNTANPYFRPAARNQHYNPAAWALTPHIALESSTLQARMLQAKKKKERAAEQAQQQQATQGKVKSLFSTVTSYFW